MLRRNIFINNPEKEKELVHMYTNSNLNTVELGQYFGVSKHAIRNNLLRLNVPVTKRPKGKGKELLDVNVDQIVEMYEDNNSVARIAQMMGVDRTTVELRLTNRGYDLSSIRMERKYAGSKSAYYKLYRKYQANAEFRGYSFDMTEAEFFKFLQGNCVYCGDAPKQLVTNNKNKALYNGVDRVDNVKGYTKDNCVSCCWVCNRFKLDMTADEVKAHVAKMHKHLF